jgi:crotonobetainyl-CoA:carnitine CoA-transferase CaiB-like acyl-CoA transferase
VSELRPQIAGPLAGIRVVDLAQMYAGPLAAAYLADFGADVIKVEPPWGESGRAAYNLPGDKKESKPFLALNRNKRGVVVNLRTEAGRTVVHDLCRTADVVICNFRDATARRLGVDYETLSRLNPGLVYGQVTAFGSRGPDRDKPAYDLVVQARTGILGARRWPDGTPLTFPVMVSDMAAALQLAFGISLALIERGRSGRGQKVEVSLLGAALAMQTSYLVRLQGDASGLPGGPSVNTCYRCGDGEYLIIVVITEEEWHRLCQALDLSHLAEDTRFNDYSKRQAEAETLVELLAGVFETRTREEWLGILEEYGIPCGPVRNREAVFEDPQVEANDLLARIDHPVVGPLEVVGVTVKLGRTPGRVVSPSPTLGQHTELILRELGYTPDQIAALRAQGVVGC